MPRTFDCRLERRVLLLAGQMLLGMILVFAPYVAANEPAAPEPQSAPPILPQKRLAQLANRTAKPFRVAYLGTSGTMLPLWMAKESGAFAREALEVEVISMAASAAIPALVAGDLDAVEMSAAPVLTASLRGHDIVFVAGLLNTMIWSFFVRPEIQRTEELRGKVVGTDRPATPVAYGTLVALKKLGLSPKEVQLYAVGGSAQIVAAFMSGQLAGGIAGPPASFQLERAGFRAVVDLLDVPYQNVGIVIKRRRARQSTGFAPARSAGGHRALLQRQGFCRESDFQIC